MGIWPLQRLCADHSPSSALPQKKDSRYSSAGTSRTAISSGTSSFSVNGIFFTVGVYQRQPQNLSRKSYTPYSVPRGRPPAITMSLPTVRMMKPSLPTSSAARSMPNLFFI